MDSVVSLLTAAVKFLQAMVETDGSEELPESVKSVVKALSLGRDEVSPRTPGFSMLHRRLPPPPSPSPPSFPLPQPRSSLPASIACCVGVCVEPGLTTSASRCFSPSPFPLPPSPFPLPPSPLCFVI
jgi:hypothetical protein